MNSRINTGSANKGISMVEVVGQFVVFGFIAGVILGVAFVVKWFIHVAE
jgi:hypothetical protein